MNKLKKVNKLKKNKVIDYLSQKEIILILNKPFSLKEKTLFLIFLETGCTISEFTNLKVKNIDFNKNTIRLRKNKNSICSINKETINKIKIIIKQDEIKSNDYLFKSRESSQITERRVQQILLEIGHKIEIKLNQRLLRTTFAIRSFLNRIPLKEIERILGINNAQNYIYKFFKEKDLEVLT